MYSYLVLGVCRAGAEGKPMALEVKYGRLKEKRGQAAVSFLPSYWFIVWFCFALLEMFPKAPEGEKPSKCDQLLCSEPDLKPWECL